jgi:hypothetical protein
MCGATYCYGRLYAQQNLYFRSIASAHDPLILNIGVNIGTLGNEGI